MTYDELLSTLQITGDDQLEEFLIDAIEVEAVKGKLDGARRVFLITGCVYRQFDKAQWQALRTQLSQWHVALKKANEQLATLNAGELVESAA